MDENLKTHIERGQLENVVHEIENVANVNTLFDDGFTPLTKCSTFSHYNLEIAKVLLERGADVNIRDRDGKSVLHRCCYNNYPEILKLILKYNPDINIREGFNRTPLMIAAHYGHIEIAKKIIDCGANLYLEDRVGRTFLEYIGNKNNKDKLREWSGIPQGLNIKPAKK